MKQRHDYHDKLVEDTRVQLEQELKRKKEINLLRKMDQTENLFRENLMQEKFKNDVVGKHRQHSDLVSSMKRKQVEFHQFNRRVEEERKKAGSLKYAITFFSAQGSPNRGSFTASGGRRGSGFQSLTQTRSASNSKG